MKAEIKQIAAHYGTRHQTFKTLEELGELTAELSRFAILNNEPLHLVSVAEIDEQLTKVIGEIADVEIMLTQMKFFFNCDDAVETVKKQKIVRQLERMRAEK